LSVAGSADVTLSTAQSQNLYFNFTGALTGNINVIFPASAGRIIIVNNATSGAFTLTVKPSGGTGFLVTQGSQQFVQIDGTANSALAPQYDILPFEVSLASATTTDLGATGTNVVAISGTTTITSLGSSASVNECLYFVRFTGALLLTYNATSLILPGATNITTTAGDCAIFKYEGSSHWRCMVYTLAAGVPNSGTVNSGTANQLAYYASSTNAVNGTTALPNGTTATTQTAGDTTTKVATNAFVNTTALTLATGSTATTQSTNDSSTKVATTAFSNPGSAVSANGYQKLPSGIVLQWGNSGNISANSSATVTYPLAFPNNVFSITSTPTNNGVPANASAVTNNNTSNFTQNNGTGSTCSFYWMAIGN
jgi:hypothetical protein